MPIEVKAIMLCDISDPKDIKTQSLNLGTGILSGRLGRQSPIAFAIVEVTVSIAGHRHAHTKVLVSELLE